MSPLIPCQCISPSYKAIKSSVPYSSFGFSSTYFFAPVFVPYPQLCTVLINSSFFIFSKGADISLPGRSSVLLSVIYLTLIPSPQIGHNAKSPNSLTPVCFFIKSSFSQLISIPHLSQIPLYLNFLIIWIIISPHSLPGIPF